MITSYTNPKLKNIRELMNRSRARKKAGAFVTEGIRMFNEIPEELIEEVYVSESFHEKNPGISGETVSEPVFRKLSDTQNPQGILCVVKQPEFDPEACLSREQGLYLILERIQDPGNLGTIVRTAEAAGVSCIIMDRDTTDLYAPKVIRSTMGSVFRVPCFYTEDLSGTIAEMKAKGIVLYAADLKGSVFYNEVKYPGKTAFMIGNEGNGLKPETAEKADERIKIPMKGKTESLNAAVAAALLMYGYMNAMV
ncbi:MAG: RNA methyltransferase [Lachnospiraceae bacterium]|nr:RNA methyltransferase [Lachnospiraceae bacterium]